MFLRSGTVIVILVVVHHLFDHAMTDFAHVVTAFSGDYEPGSGHMFYLQLTNG